MAEARDKSFDRIADEYDKIRPGYPRELYERIVSFGALTPAARVLEVGVGTGKATVPLAERGFAVVGLEPGAKLAAIARANLAGFARVSIHATSFEQWPVERAAFDLACCAQAYHWLDPELRLPKLAEALREGGVLAVFGHWALPPAELVDDLELVYAQQAPALVGERQPQSWYSEETSPVMVEMRASTDFVDAELTSFKWQRPLTAAAYCALISTYSEHSTLPPSQLASLLAGVSETIDEHGGTIALQYTTGLFLARRSAHHR
jgi:SAM-dependent methyltransferase